MRGNGHIRWLGCCAALAAGELLAAVAPVYVEAWPVFALASVLAVLFGYGLSIPLWRYLAIFLAGIALYQVASVSAERVYRESPWLRGRSHSSLEVKDPVRRSSFFREIRRDLSTRIGLGLEASPEAAALNRAILLGERARLPRELKRAFVESGTMHVFAISGLHVMAVAGVLVFLFQLLFLPRRWLGLFVLPVLWFYVLIIGSTPSAIRAAVMATFALLAPCVWRRADLLRSWCLTFLLVAVLSPRVLSDVGAVLSFTVMLAIALAAEWGREFGWWGSKLFMTFVAWAAGAPISICVFGRVTPGGLLANLVMLPAVAWSVSVGLVGLFASYVSTVLAGYLNNLSALFTTFMVGLSRVISAMPGANFEIGRRPWLEAGLLYALFALSAFLWRYHRAQRDPTQLTC